MIALPRSNFSAIRHVSPAGNAFLFGFACVVLGLFGTRGLALAGTAGARPAPGIAGPVSIAPEPNALSQFVHPDDFVVFDPSGAAPANATVTVINGGFSGTFGATTVVASPTVGSGVAFNPTSQGCISPSQQLYYWDQNISAFVAVDLTTATFPRTLVPVPANTALVPGSLYTSALPGMVWDYSTNTILYIDNGASTAKSTIARGIYRLNPVTGTNTLYAPFTAATLNSIAIKQDGSAVYGFNQNGNTLGVNASVYQIAPTAGTTTVVDGGAALYGNTSTQPRYYEAAGISWDIVNQKITLFDVGDDQTSSRIIRIDPVAKTRSFISNGSAGASATYGGTVINSPDPGFTNTAGRIFDTDEDAGLTLVFPASLVSGSPTETRVGTSQFSNTATHSTYVPPTLPTITTPTATNAGSASVETLGGNVTSAGTAIVTPAIQSRGVVYSATSTNPAPVIGGTGVTQVAASAATGVFTVSASSLNGATSYTYAAYVSTFYGTVYTAFGTFTTPAPPTVTSPTATAITGASATLGGNVVSDGGSTINARGIVYSTTANNSNPTIGGTGVTNLVDASATTGVFTDGTGNNLANGTAYSYKAYAINAIGTSYSAAGNFTTVAKPTANSQSVTAAFNTAKAITLTGSDPNTPTQTLTYTIASNPAHGTLSGFNSATGAVTFTPTANYQGADSLTFTTTNTSGLTSTAATVSITVTPGTPTANGQSVSANFNTATAVTLTGTDPDSPALTLSYTVLTSPTHGTLSGTAPNLTYTPTANYQGTDSFTFQVSNGTNTSTAATVSVTVASGTPTANGQSVSTNFNTAKAITLTGTDPDSPALTLSYTVATAPTHGTLSGTAPNLTYTPTANYQGADSFTFTVSNGQKTSTAATVSITVAAGTPTATAQSVIALLNTPKPITLAGTDPDSPALALSYTVTVNPANGTLSGTAPNLTYTPTTGFTGADSFAFTVSNGQKTSVAATVSITVVGEPYVTSFTAGGQVGSTVTITGNNFLGTTGITFFRNVAATTFTVASNTQLTATVPTGATSGVITITNGLGTNTTSTKFTVMP